MGAVTEGDLFGKGRSVFMLPWSRRAARTGVRASVVARKRGNARGAKGRRKVTRGRAMPPESIPAPVPMATQAGDIRARWAWTEPRVWTDRMLTALEQGVKGGVWFSLIDKVY